jgi:hypothetical protein
LNILSIDVAVVLTQRSQSFVRLSEPPTQLSLSPARLINPDERQRPLKHEYPKSQPDDDTTVATCKTRPRLAQNSIEKAFAPLAFLRCLFSFITACT